MRPGTRFFIYGMNSLEVLLQMPASTHGLNIICKILELGKTMQNMLPVCLRIQVSKWRVFKGGSPPPPPGAVEM